MHTEAVTLTVDGAEYEGELALPEGETDHGVVLLPGANHGPYGDVFDRLATALAGAGIALLRFETWGDGPELPDLDAKPFEDIHAEYGAAVEVLRDRGYDRVDVVAKSFGGRIALEHVPEGVDRLVLWAPACFLADGEAIETVDPPEGVEPPVIERATVADNDRPVDVLQGDEDDFPVANARELAETLPDGDYHVLEGADHSFVGGRVETETVELTVDLLTD